MKTLFFTDMHATVKHGLFGMGFLNQVSETFKFIADRANAEKVDAVFFLGDIFHFKQSIDTPSLHVVKQGFRDLVETTKDFPIYIIPGNHDLYKKDGLWTSVSALSDLAPSNRVHVIAEESTVNVCGSVIQVVPYTELGYTASSSAHFMVGHLEVKGAMYEPGGMVENHGVENVFVDGRENEIRYIGGHYHHPQIVGQSLVVGSCMYHSYKDQITDAPRGAVLLTLDTPRIPVVTDFQWIENPAAEPCHTIRANTHEEAENEMKRLKEICHIPADKWHIRTFLPSLESDKIDKRRIPKGISFTVIPNDPVVSIRRTAINQQMSPELAFQEYLNQVPPVQFSDKILRLGTELLRGGK